MVTIFNTSSDAIVICTLITIYFITASVTLFNKRLIQAEKNGNLLPGHPMLPPWVGLLVWVNWLTLLALFLLSYKVAIAALIIKFVLSVLPGLDILGSILMSPFTKKRD